MSDLDPNIQNPIEDQIEASHTDMRAKNRAYKATIGVTRDRDSEVLKARQRLDEAEGTMAGAKQSEAEAKTDLVAAIDGHSSLLSKARGMLVPPGQ